MAISLAKFFLAAQDGGYSLWHLVSQPAAEIAGSLLLGAALGLVLAFGQKGGDSDELLIITLGVILTSMPSQVIGPLTASGQPYAGPDAGQYQPQF